MDRDAKRTGVVSRWGPAVVLMGVIFLFSSIPGEDFPSWPNTLDFVISKGGHMFGYGLLAAAFLRGVGDFTTHRYKLAWGLAVLYGASDELHQSFVPGRMNSFLDIGIDALGALAGLFLLRLIFWRGRRE